MKLFSLSVLSLLATLAASAEVVMVNGTIYDVGKGAKSVSSGNNINMDNRQGDSALCWAATASNLFQHWQDKYLPAGSTAPNGLNGTNYTTPTGTRYLSIFDLFVDSVYNYSGNYGVAVEWYFHGKDIAYMLKNGANKGPIVNRSDVDSWQYSFEGDKYTTPDPSYQFNNLTGLKSALNNAFTKQGIGVYLSLGNTAYNGGHAISCWGYETDESGTIVALMVSDSDDKQFGARRLAVEQKADGKIYLETSNPQGTYNETEGAYVLNSVSYLRDPLATARSASANTSLSSVIASSSAVSEAVEAKGTVNVNKSISLEAGSILAASGKANNNKLTIRGNGGTALDAKIGSFINVRDTQLAISNTSGDGLHLAAEAYLDNGSVDISNCSGTGIVTNVTVSDGLVYLEMNGNDSVKVSNNKAGGMIVNSIYENYTTRQSRVDISHNGSVEFSSNSVSDFDGGGAIRTKGVITMTDNDTITFSGNKSNYNYYDSCGGGAIDVKTSTDGRGNVTIADNGIVTFDKNEANGPGGAVKASGVLTIKDNDEVNFTGNKSNQNLYGGGGLAVTGGYYSGGQVTITGNGKIVFDANSAKAAGSAILATGKTLTLSNNGVVEFTNNTGGNGSVIRNEANSVVEIAHNDSVKFSGNEGTADISNNGTLYVSADAGKSITFEHGIKNDAKGVAYLGKDSAGAVSTGGKYAFADNGHSVTLETGVATVKADGGMLFDGSKLEVSKTDFASTDIKFTLESSSLKLSEVTFVDGASLTVDFGYFAEKNKLTLDDVTRTGASNVGLSMLIDLVDARATQKTTALASLQPSTGLETQVFSARQNGTVIHLSDYLNEGVDLSNFSLTLLLDGWRGEGDELAVYTDGYNLSEVTVMADKYTYDHTEAVNGGQVLYYYGKAMEDIPEPATATLSLLALAALCARRRRKH